MFTPTKRRQSSFASRSSISTPRATALRNASRTSLLRRSIAPRSSLSVTNSSFIGSPTVTTVFGSAHHCIESYESSTPVLITEQIALSNDLSAISVKVDESGWAWLVYGLKLFVWSHRSGVSKIPTCKELPLRAITEDDAYLSELVALDYNDDTGSISVFCVSLQGQAMYWPNILSTTTASGELKLDLQGQDTQCFNVVSVQEHGFIMCTTSASLYVISPSQQSGITCKELSKWEGALSSIGRRVSSFFFSQSHENQNVFPPIVISVADVCLPVQVVQMTVSPTKTYGEYDVLLLTEMHLQHLKCFFHSEKETASVEVLTSMDFNERLVPKLSSCLWENTQSGCSMWPLDVRCASRRGQVALLVALAESTDDGSTMHYIVCVFDDLNRSDDMKAIMLDFTSTYSEATENESLGFKLIVEDPFSRQLEHFAIWSGDRILLKSLVSVDGDYKEDHAPFDRLGDRILGAGQCGSSCIFFSAVHGLVTSSSSLERTTYSTMEDSILDMSSTKSPASSTMKSLPGTPVVSRAKMEKLEASDNATQRLQAAFLHYCRLNLDQARSLVNEAFPLDVSNESLDSAVAVVSEELVDDYPAQDPRWAESVPGDLSSESAGSLILQHQLEDKLKAHNLFLKFLSDVEIWDRLSHSGTGRDRVITRWLLWEHAEKLHASLGLLQKHVSHHSIVDAAIQQVLNRRENMTNAAGLTPRDFFYREVTKIEEIFESLVEEEEKALLRSSLSSRERATIVTGVNAIIEAMLTRVYQYRKSIDLTFVDRSGKHCEFVPWTVGTSRAGVRSTVTQQHKLTFERGIPKADDGQQRALLCQSLVILAELVLDGYLEQLASLSQSGTSSARLSEVNTAFATHRSQLIKPLLLIGQREKAASLSEKYQDFDILVQVCDEGGDMDRISKYMIKFAEQGFPEFLFRWFLDKGEYRKLLTCCDEAQIGELRLFLRAHPNLAWMQQVRAGELSQAHDTLRYLASNETANAMRKKNYLSLSKLAAVFSDDSQDDIDDKVEDIVQEHTLLKYQEALPSAVLDSVQMHPDTMPVFTPDKLIQLYIGEMNLNANEVDFKKAFELLQYLPDSSMTDDDEESSVGIEEWKLRIWCRLILRDNWKDVDTTLDPFDACNHTVLFKTLMLAHSAGLLSEIFPNVQDLFLREELSKFVNDTSFLYLMRASFERVQRSLLSAET